MQPGQPATGEYMMAEKRKIKLHSEWLAALGEEFEQDYMQQLRAFLIERSRQGAVIYPPGRQIFSAFDSTPLSRVRVVILGQDPYHGPGQAHGLCFSVGEGVQTPPSLRNIFKELESDLGLSPPAHGHLQAWAQQGVLLLNTVLTVERGQPASHRERGWERLTDTALRAVNERCQRVVFMLWGSHARRKAALVDGERHLVLEAPHPSPLSAHRGFFGCRHFSRANRWLEDNGVEPVNWQL